MAVITARTGDRSWATATDWVGDTLPADNTDSAVIPASCNMLMNQDQKAYTGLLGVTVQGHATTPGKLYWKDGTDGWLKLKTGYSIAGSSGTAKGQILANSDGVWATDTPLAQANRAVIMLEGTATIDAQYLDIKLLGNEPTTKSVRCYGTTAAFTAAADDVLTLTTTEPAILTANAPVYVSTTAGDLPAGLTAGTLYYVRTVSGSTCKLSTTPDDSNIVDITDAGTGTHYITTGIVTVPPGGIASDIITTAIAALPTTPWKNNEPVMFTSSGTYPTGITANTVYYVNTLSGGTFKVATVSGGTAITLGTSWTGTLRAYLGSASTTSLTVATLDDVTGESTYWIAGAGTFATTTVLNAAILADAAAPANYDIQRVAIAGIIAGVITLSEAVDSAQYPNYTITLCSRNVAIQSACTTDIYIVNYTSDTTASGIFGCEIRSAATANKGYGLREGTGHTVSGVVSGCNYGVNAGTGHTVSGVVSGCSSGIYTGTGHTVSGVISGCSTGVNAGTGHTVSGVISGCNYGIYTGTGHTVSGVVSGCSTGIYGGTGHTVSGVISGCTYGIYGGIGYTVSGVISGCTYGIRLSSCLLAGATLSTNSQDFYQANSIIGHGASSKSTAQYTGYLASQYTTPGGQTTSNVVLYDIGDSGGTPQLGQVKAWQGGGTVVTEAAPGVPPASLTFAYKHTPETPDPVTVLPVFLDFPLMAKQDILLTVKVYVKLNATGMTGRPTFALLDPAVLGDPANAPSSTLDTEQAADTTDWQTITLTYTETVADRQVILRCQGADTANNYWHWMYRVITQGVFDNAGVYAATGILDDAGDWHEYGTLDSLAVYNAAGIIDVDGAHSDFGLLTSVTHIAYADGVLEDAGATRYTLADTGSEPYITGAAAQKVTDAAFLETNKDEIITTNTDILAEFGVTGTAVGGGFSLIGDGGMIG